MTLKKLGCWHLASGNVVEVVATIGAGDKPVLLDLRCEWDRFPPSAKDVLEYQQRVQRAIGEALAALAGGRVLVVNAGGDGESQAIPPTPDYFMGFRLGAAGQRMLSIKVGVSSRSCRAGVSNGRNEAT